MYHQLEAVQPVKLCKSLQKESLIFWTVALLDHYNFHCMRVGILVVMYARTLRYRGITPPVHCFGNQAHCELQWKREESQQEDSGQ